MRSLDESVSLIESELLLRRVEALEQQFKELKVQRGLSKSYPRAISDDPYCLWAA
jgi:hypothetical protein